MKKFQSMTEKERIEHLTHLNKLCFSSLKDFEYLEKYIYDLTKMIALNVDIKNHNSYESFVFEYMLDCWIYYSLAVASNNIIYNYILKEMEKLENKWKNKNYKYKNIILNNFIYPDFFNEFEVLEICVNKYPFTQDLLKNMPIMPNNWWHIGYALFYQLENLFSLFNDPPQSIYQLRKAIATAWEEMKELIDESDKNSYSVDRPSQ